jgi:hypothetical protein
MKTHRKALLSIAIVGMLAVLGFFIAAHTKTEEMREEAKHHKTVALLQSLSQSLKAYETEYGLTFDRYPFASNPQILKTLTGDNPRKIHFAEFAPQNMDPTGSQITDSWGTPIHFILRSDALPAIRSLGRDRTLGTSDDLAANE